MLTVPTPDDANSVLVSELPMHHDCSGLDVLFARFRGLVLGRVFNMPLIELCYLRMLCF